MQSRDRCKILYEQKANFGERVKEKEAQVLDKIKEECPFKPQIDSRSRSAERPIVLAEKRERGGAGLRMADLTRQTFFAGQRLSVRNPIGTEETLRAADGKGVKAFYDRWYRPENTVIVVAGDADPLVLAGSSNSGSAIGKAPCKAALRPISVIRLRPRLHPKIRLKAPRLASLRLGWNPICRAA